MKHLVSMRNLEKIMPRKRGLIWHQEGCNTTDLPVCLGQSDTATMNQFNRDLNLMLQTSIFQGMELVSCSGIDHKLSTFSEFILAWPL